MKVGDKVLAIFNDRPIYREIKDVYTFERHGDTVMRMYYLEGINYTYFTADQLYETPGELVQDFKNSVFNVVNQ